MHIYHPLLNHYILVQIFGFLKNQRDIYNCTLVNAQWNISATPFLYRAPKFTNPNLNSTKCLQTIKKAKEQQTLQPYNEMVLEWKLKDSIDIAYDIAECCPNIEKLSCNNEALILCNDNVKGEEQEYPLNISRRTLLKHWNKLKSVTLYRNCGTDLILEAIRTNCNRLEELILGNCSVTDAGLIGILKTCKGLKSLELRQCHEISDQSLTIMSEYCNSLIKLDLRECNKIKDDGILALSSSYFVRNLHSLHLEALNIKEHPLLVLAENTVNLQKLYLRRLDFINDEIVAAFGIGNKSCLKHLTLHFCPKVIGWGIKEATGIRELSLFMRQNIKLQELVGICDTCQLLEKFTLDVFTFSYDSDTDIINTLSQLKNLKSLALFCGTKKFSPMEIFELRQNCKKLAQINC